MTGRSGSEDKLFQAGVELCREHMAFASKRGDYPGFTPGPVADAVTVLSGTDREAFLRGYEKELERYEAGVSKARRELDAAKQ